MSFKSLARKAYHYILNKNQPIFSFDWFSPHIENWETWLAPLKNNKNLYFLEIGCFEGRATRWLLENILTHPTAKIYCIDTFLGSMEHEEDSVDMTLIKKNFHRNIKPYRNKVSVLHHSSHDALRDHHILFKSHSFDFIYIDGSHKASDVLEDAILSFRLLKKNGIMLFDDYEWQRYENPILNPKIAIDAWLACFADQYELVYQGWQLCIKKIV